VPTVTGKPWRSQTMRSMLMSGRIAGLREHHGVVVASAAWPGIIDRDTHERLRAVLSDSGRQKFNGIAARRYLLTGFLVCGRCGAKLVARPRNDKRRAYVCASGPNFGGCGKIGRLAGPVEELVSEQVLDRLSGPALAAALEAATGEDQVQRELLAVLRADQERLDELVDAFADGTLNRAGFVRAKSRVEGRMEATRRRLARLASSKTLASLPNGGSALRAAWEAHDDHAGLSWRRALIGAVAERVVLHPCVPGRNRFDPSRVEVVWRG
jgi:site-specific DNA recombinase